MVAGVRLSDEVRRNVIRLSAMGRTYRQIIDEAGVSMGVITKVMRRFGGVIRAEDWRPSSARLSLPDRVNLKVWIEQELTFDPIQRLLDLAS